MHWTRLLLLPLALIYQFAVNLRHKFYDFGFLKSESFDIPIICVGNLSFGGTGKTPLTEYLVGLMQPHFKLAILSRGYKRKSKGFVMAGKASTFHDIGDEPVQFARKFQDVYVAVDADRREGINILMQQSPPPEVIILDDAFQHRKVKAGLNILLTDYHNIYPKDHLVPAGNLRDSKYAARRADIIVVTKTPKVFSPFIRRSLIDAIKPLPHQMIYFSYLKYGRFEPVGDSKKIYLPKQTSNILLFCGIANPYPLQEYLYTMCNTLETINFRDHHEYTEKDILGLSKSFSSIIGKSKIMVTTEKDAMRLVDSPYFCHLENVPLFYIPVTVHFHDEKDHNFDNQVVNYARQNKGNHGLH
jgi:tetraacyldisaccharide 4'-kinase